MNEPPLCSGGAPGEFVRLAARREDGSNPHLPDLISGRILVQRNYAAMRFSREKTRQARRPRVWFDQRERRRSPAVQAVPAAVGCGSASLQQLQDQGQEKTKEQSGAGRPPIKSGRFGEKGWSGRFAGSTSEKRSARCSVAIRELFCALSRFSDTSDIGCAACTRGFRAASPALRWPGHEPVRRLPHSHVQASHHADPSADGWRHCLRRSVPGDALLSQMFCAPSCEAR